MLERPWPSMLRGIWGDPERYRDTYWITLRRQVLRGRRRQARRRGLLLAARPGRRHHARRRATTSRRPRSSPRSSTIPSVAEAAVVGRTDATTGQAIAAFVTLRGGIEPTRRAGRGAARPRRQAHRPDREAEDDPLHRGAAEDALGQDHAPAAAQRRRGRGARRHHDARRSRQSSTASRRSTSRRQPPTRSERRRRLPYVSPSTGPGATGRSSPARAVVVDIDGVLSDASTPPALHRGAAPGLARVLRRVRRGPGHRRGAARCSTCSTPTLQIVLLTARPHRVTYLTEAWLRRYEIRWDLLIMRPWGDYDLARDFKQATVWELRSAGFELRARVRGRPPQRRDVPLRGHPLPLRPLRLLRLSRWSARRLAARRAAAGSQLGSQRTVLHGGWEVRTRSTGVRPTSEVTTDVQEQRQDRGAARRPRRRSSWASARSSAGRPRHRARSSGSSSSAARTGSPTRSRCKAAGAKPVSEADAPQLYSIVRDLTHARRHADAGDLHQPGRRSRTRSRPAATSTTPRSR